MGFELRELKTGMPPERRILMKVLVTGSAGVPGYDVLRLLKERGIPCLGVDSPELDLSDAPAVRSLIAEYAPDTIVHCAGWTDADKAESLPEKCAALNGMGTLTVARGAAAAGASMLYLSSPQVFPGTGDAPWQVQDPYGPKNVFGMSKVQGEDAVRSLLKRYYIVRADWIYGSGKRDFLRPFLKEAQEKKLLRVSGDQFGSPTWAGDLARVICDLIATRHYGIWHARNEGFYSRAEFASMILEKTGIPCRIESVPTAEIPGAARRPLNCRMAAELPAGIAPMPSVEEGLECCLSALSLR